MPFVKCPYCKKTIVRLTAKTHLYKCVNKPRKIRKVLVVSVPQTQSPSMS